MRILANKMMFTGGPHSKKRNTSTASHQKRYGITQDKYYEKGRLSCQEVTPLFHIGMASKFLVIFRFDCVHAFGFL